MRLTELDRRSLQDIVDQCDLIGERLKRIGCDESRFRDDSLYHDGCAFCLLQIGEAANRLSDVFIDETHDMNWHKVIGMRNIITHAYGKFDLTIAWQVVTKDIPALRRFCVDALDKDR